MVGKYGTCIDKIQKSRILLSPFAHVVVDDFLPTEAITNVHDELSMALSNSSSLGSIVKPSQYKDRTMVQQDVRLYPESLQNMKLGVLESVVDFLGSGELGEAIRARFEPYLKHHALMTDEQIAELGKFGLNDSSFVINQPALKSKRREIHLDSSQTALVCLLYVRLNDDWSSGGSLYLYSHEDRWSQHSFIGGFLKNLFGILPADLTVEKVVDYRDNRLVMFVENPSAYHEVSTRRYAKTPRMCFHSNYVRDNEPWKQSSPLLQKLRSMIR